MASPPMPCRSARRLRLRQQAPPCRKDFSSFPVLPFLFSAVTDSRARRDRHVQADAMGLRRQASLRPGTLRFV